MPRINLLPWREAERRDRKQRFLIALGAATVVAIAFTFIAYLTFSSMIDAQLGRNRLLQGDIRVLDHQIAEINDLEADKRRFIARMDIIEKLQRSRPAIVHLFDTIVRAVPPGVYLTGVVQHGEHLKFKGIAQSSTRVSSFMRDIDSSRWLKNPALEIVQARRDGSLSSTFVLDAEQINPETADSGDGAQLAGGPVAQVARRGVAP